MKILLLVSLLACTVLSQAFEDMRVLPNQYTVTSDGKDSNIKEGTFKIEGTVRMMSSYNPLQNVVVGCTSSGLWVRTDSVGHFSLELKATDSVIYFYLDGWSELVIEDYNFKEKHLVTMDVTLYQIAQGNSQLKRKPVIYMYSDENISASVQLDPLGQFTFTYPEYKNGWQVELNKENGIFVDGQSYPYLFWEAESNDLKYTIKDGVFPGLVLEKDDVVAYLEKSLTEMGLNAVEKTDFITYWGPILTRSKYAFIQFIIDDAYEKNIAHLSIEPEPNHSKRIFILCSPLNDEGSKINFSEQKFSNFKRTGFTVVEWGGSVLDVDLLHP